MGTSISQILTVTTPALGVAPGQATGLTVSNVTTTSLTLSWTPPTTGSPPISYQAQVAVGNSSSFSNNGPIITGTSTSVVGLTPNTSYTLQVLAINSTSTSTSLSVAAQTSAVPPAPPTAVAVSGTPGTTSINLTWTAPVTGTGPFTYQVFSRTPSGSGTFTAVGSSTTSTSQAVTGLTSGSSYDFQVVATNAAGSSAPSVSLTNVTTATTAVAPSAPLNLAAGTITSTSIALTWSAPTTGTPPLTYVVQWRPH